MSLRWPILALAAACVEAEDDPFVADADLDVDPSSPCDADGARGRAPERLEHVIVILMQNRDAGEVTWNGAAPYFNSLRKQCGSSTAYLDDTFDEDLPSLPHYLVLTAGSNCDAGIGDQGKNCVTGDGSPHAHRVGLRSIFEQVGSWKAYQEDMPSSCNWGNPAGGTLYWVKHNPPAYFERLDGECHARDVGIARIECSGRPGGGCSRPENALVADLANDALPAFSFVTPDVVNCMHDGSVATGDNWLATYLPIVFASPAYRRGGTAVYVLWDEQNSYDNGPLPNLFVSPYVRPTTSSAKMNHAAALRAMEDQLGLSEHLGCASGTPPGGVGRCADGSTTDLRAVFGF